MNETQHEFVKFKHVQELGGLELLNASYVQKQFSKHVHEGYCIGVIEEGAQSFYRTGALHVAPKGDIILVNADEVHTGSSAVATGWRYRAIYPTPEMLSEIGRDVFVDRHGAPWFPQAVVRDEGLAQQLCLLFDLLEQKEKIETGTSSWGPPAIEHLLAPNIIFDNELSLFLDDLEVRLYRVNIKVLPKQTSKHCVKQAIATHFMTSIPVQPAIFNNC